MHRLLFILSLSFVHGLREMKPAACGFLPSAGIALGSRTTKAIYNIRREIGSVCGSSGSTPDVRIPERRVGPFSFSFFFFLFGTRIRDASVLIQGNFQISSIQISLQAPNRHVFLPGPQIAMHRFTATEATYKLGRSARCTPANNTLQRLGHAGAWVRFPASGLCTIYRPFRDFFKPLGGPCAQ
ncbi:hypothetical protein C8R47DRAFT_399603 [Mycena vitilis]|nr:hypothetical protein C8R47DRAFT_399603 [Mycena vitilis]